MLRLVAENPDILNAYAKAAYSAVAPSGAQTLQCCSPVEDDAGSWSIGCKICLGSSVPLLDGLVREVV